MAESLSKNAALVICAIFLGVVVVSSVYIIGAAPSTDLKSFMSFSEMEAFLQRGLSSGYRESYGIMMDNFGMVIISPAMSSISRL